MVTEEDSLLDRNNIVKLWSRKGTFPALQLEWLAVTKPMQKNGIGKISMGKVLDVFISAIESVGVPVLVLRAINPDTAVFYRKLGFVDYGPNNDRMPRLLLPAKTALELKSVVEDF